VAAVKSAGEQLRNGSTKSTVHAVYVTSQTPTRKTRGAGHRRFTRSRADSLDEDGVELFDTLCSFPLGLAWEPTILAPIATGDTRRVRLLKYNHAGR
jgi:hypothetical protein